ncbi:DNA cytosine methyltransferase [Silvibacterium acidisoli]|uniref:DNA cytosine methyltransferase n=1 Tax=Acidobacteriaceae bacterium ZG23-2 TaxID=2883246 RepID=UPI00406C0F08
MKYLDVCSGISAPTAAWKPLGWKAVAFAEIEKAPSAVIAHHYADTPNLGDMTKFEEWPDYADLDVLVGGTPCQSYSIAGKRKGLADPRGRLMLSYLGIARRYRPRWVVWENVPGVLSSNGGRDFGTFLGALGELGYSFAYRVLDAQYFGVAQRRERVFVVGHLGDWRRAAEVLFERESLRWHPAPRREAREDVAPTLSARTSGGGGLGTDFDCDGGLIVGGGQSDCELPHHASGEGRRSHHGQLCGDWGFL